MRREIVWRSKTGRFCLELYGGVELWAWCYVDGDDYPLNLRAMPIPAVRELGAEWTDFCVAAAKHGASAGVDVPRDSGRNSANLDAADAAGWR